MYFSNRFDNCFHKYFDTYILHHNVGFLDRKCPKNWQKAVKMDINRPQESNLTTCPAYFDIKNFSIECNIKCQYFCDCLSTYITRCTIGKYWIDEIIIPSKHCQLIQMFINFEANYLSNKTRGVYFWNFQKGHSKWF